MAITASGPSAAISATAARFIVIGYGGLPRRRPHPRAELLLGRGVDHPAHGLAEVHVVDGRDRRQQRAGRRRERAHRCRDEVVGGQPVDGERVLGVGREPVTVGEVERTGGGDRGVADVGRDRDVGLGDEGDGDRVGADGRDLGGPDLAHAASLTSGDPAARSGSDRRQSPRAALAPAGPAAARR